MDHRYEIQSKIGVSALGSVYRGFDRVGNRDVAIRRLSTHRSDGFFRDDPVGILSRQAEIQSSVGHPTMVRIHDIGLDGEDTVLVMDLVEGESLDHRLERSVLSWREFRSLVVEVLEGLSAAHEIGVLHGDLKPSNLMISELPLDGLSIRILDFGLADLINPHPGDNKSCLELPLDTLHCLAPERFSADSIPSVFADLYALGCISYYSLCLHWPFVGDNGNEIMESHLQHRLRALKDVRPDLPAWVNDWAMWMMNRMPEHRPVSAREALEVFIANEQASRASSMGVGEGI